MDDSIKELLEDVLPGLLGCAAGVTLAVIIVSLVAFALFSSIAMELFQGFLGMF